MAAVQLACLLLVVLVGQQALASEQFWVSVGSFTEQQYATDRAEQAQLLTGDLFDLHSKTTDTGVFLRVSSGPYFSRADAQVARDRYLAKGFADSWIWIEHDAWSSVYVPLDIDEAVLDDTQDQVASTQNLPQLVSEAPAGYGLNRLRASEELKQVTRKTRQWLSGTDFDVRIKAFSSLGLLPDHDAQRALQGSPVSDSSLDMRMMLKQRIGPVDLIAHHSAVVLHGDRVALNLGTNASLDQTVVDDRRRRWRWSWDIEDGPRHQSFHRLDRLALEWQVGNWGFTAGRQAVSWGGGIVFQPMDLFSPFSPTVVDRDYKAGDDLILIDRLLSNGHDLQFLHVARTDEFSDVTQEVASTALKWHGYWGALEFELLVAEHYDRRIYGAALRLPVGPALIRTDIVASENQVGDMVYSGMLNADLSFPLIGRNAYAFAEYFHNGWGVTQLPDDIQQLPLELSDRLGRGELFNLMKNYVALGLTYEWHPLITQTTTVISNLHDNSSLLQIAVSYSPSDNQSMQLGWLEPLGRAGDEFGGVPVWGNSLTSGGGSNAYFRWVYYL